MMNDNIVIIRRLVVTSLSVMWHLQTYLSVSLGCDVVLVMLLMVVMGMGDGCEWRPLVMVMGRWVGIVKDGGGGG